MKRKAIFLAIIVFLVLFVSLCIAGERNYITRSSRDFKRDVFKAYDVLGWGEPSEDFISRCYKLFSGSTSCTGRQGQFICVYGKGRQGKLASQYEVYIERK